jgi:glycosyltransferase involved in cell wall biosynthesis
MRILLLSNWFPPILSGSSFYTASLAQALVARGHEPAVVTCDWGPDSTPARDLPYPVYRLPVCRLPKLKLLFSNSRMGLAWTPGNSRRLREIAVRHGSQLIHHVNHIFDSTFLSAGVAKKLGLPIVGSVTTPIQHESPLMQALMGVADRWTVGRFGVCRWDRVVCLDRVVKEYVRRQYGPRAAARSVLIPFGVRLDALSEYEQRGPRAARPQILFVGHIHPFRNPTQLVRAMPLVLQAVPAARLLLAGREDLPGPRAAAAELGLTDDQVCFLGETAHADVVRLMRESHVFTSWATGLYRGLGTAPMEAMLCETPVVNDLPDGLFGPGLPRHGENILLVNSRDPRSVADALVRLLTDEDLRRRIGAAGRRFVLEHLSWDRIAAQMEQLYCTLLDRSAVPAGAGVTRACNGAASRTAVAGKLTGRPGA